METLYSRMKPWLGEEKQLLERMAGRLDLWEECVRLFPREEIIAAADQALEEKDDTRLYDEVHRLKGNLANFGFDALAWEAEAVLAAIREKSAEQVGEHYRRLRNEYLKLIERIGDVEWSGNESEYLSGM